MPDIPASVLARLKNKSTESGFLKHPFETAVGNKPFTTHWSATENKWVYAEQL